MNINPNLSYVNRNSLMEKFRKFYVEAEKLLVPKIKAELKLHVKEKQPFHFLPARLAIKEKAKLKEILTDLSECGILVILSTHHG